jgi:hypothetical protein
MAKDDQTSIGEKRKASLVVGEQKGWQDQAEMAGTMKSVKATSLGEHVKAPNMHNQTISLD